MDPTSIASDSVHIIKNASIYEFGILTSNIHMAWMRAVAGRLESRYRYSKAIVYNNFIWPQKDKEIVANIELTALGILSARDNHKDMSYAEMYDELFMESYAKDLLKAHQANDKAVWEAYGKAWDITSEEDCVAHLMKLYAEMTK